MIGVWLVIAIAVIGLNASVGGETSDDFTIPGTEAQQGIDLLDERFPNQGGVSGQIVFADPDGDITDPAARAAFAETLAEFAAGPNVLAVTDPYDPANASVSADGRIAYATVRYSVDPPGPEEGEAAEAAVEIARDAGLQAELSRSIVRGSEEVEGGEMVGLAVAIIVLLVAFGSVIAAGIPIGSALFGIMIGLGLIGVMSGFTDVPSISPMLATMIGLGVGIDYALFVVTRHRGFMHEGRSPVESAALANATSGTAVLFAGTTVVVALAGLVLAGIPSIAIMGYASAVTVLVAMLGAVTLLPAFLGLAGSKIDRFHIGRRRSEAEVAAHTTRRGRWADHVGRHPWRYAIGSFVLLDGDRRPGAVDAHRHRRRRHGGERQDLPQGLRPAGRRLRPRLQRPVHDRPRRCRRRHRRSGGCRRRPVVGRLDRRDRVRHRAGVQSRIGHRGGDRLPGDVAAGAGDRGTGPHAP